MAPKSGPGQPKGHQPDPKSRPTADQVAPKSGPGQPKGQQPDPKSRPTADQMVKKVLRAGAPGPTAAVSVLPGCSVPQKVTELSPTVAPRLLESTILASQCHTEARHCATKGMISTLVVFFCFPWVGGSAPHINTELYITLH